MSRIEAGIRGRFGEVTELASYIEMTLLKMVNKTGDIGYSYKKGSESSGNFMNLQKEMSLRLNLSRNFGRRLVFFTIKFSTSRLQRYADRFIRRNLSFQL